MNSVATMDPLVVLTDQAALKVKEMIAENGASNLMLRVFVSGAGCSGPEYGFIFEEAKNDDDIMVDAGGIVLLIDSLSQDYLVGVEIDYRESAGTGQFVIRNPNITSNCNGCRSSCH